MRKTLDLIGVSYVDYVPNTECHYLLDSSKWDIVQAVGPEESAPSGDPPADGSIATYVPEVAGSRYGNVALGVYVHERLLLMGVSVWSFTDCTDALLRMVGSLPH